MYIDITINVKYDDSALDGMTSTDIVGMLRRGIDTWISEGGPTQGRPLVIEELGTSIRERP